MSGFCSLVTESEYTPLPDHDITFTSENLTASVLQDPYDLQLVYGPSGQRIKSVLKENSTTIKTKYFSLNYEKEVTGSGTRYLHYIYSPYGLVAVIINEGTTETTYLAETDHLGSIVGLLNTDGSYAEKYSYDAWGRRRNPADWTYNNVPAPTLIDRGFTGHEHIDELSLINMNGRMYDPYIGRFLSVDPVIQFTDNSQSFNGYSYCMNNPLIYTDPSGYLFSASGDRARMESYLRRNGYSQVDIWMMESDPFMGSAFDFEGSGGGGGMGYGTSFYETFIRPTQQPNFTSIKKHDGQYGYWVREWVDSYGRIVYPNGLSGGGNIPEISICERFIPIISPSGFEDFGNKFSIDFQGDSKLTIGVQAGGNVGGLGGQFGIFGNLVSVTLIGNEGKKIIYPTSQQGGYTQINQGVSGGLIIGAGVSHTFDGSFEGYGYANDSYSYLGWLSNKKGIFGITYIHSAEGNTINIGINLQIALILGFEGSYNLRIKW